MFNRTMPPLSKTKGPHQRTLVHAPRSADRRPTGRYECQEALPDLDMLLVRMHDDMVYIHAARGTGVSFDDLWDKVCKRLESGKNAFGYENWKRVSVVKNAARLRELDELLAAAWARMYSPSVVGQSPYVIPQAEVEAYNKLVEERAHLKPKSASNTDDILEIAIAYWIDAQVAHNAQDDARAMQALIKCSLYVGMTLSAKLESEAKKEAGAKQGQDIREKIVAAAVDALENLPLKKSDRAENILGLAVLWIRESETYAADLAAYDRQTRSGKKVQDPIVDRLTETLERWINDGKHRELSQAQARALKRLADLKPRPSTAKRVVQKAL